MQNRSNRKNNCPECAVFEAFRLRFGLRWILALSILIALFQFACSKKSRVNLASASVVRIAFLPFNVPDNNKDIRWTAMAAPIALAQASAKIKEFEAIPLWQTMPLAIQTAGNSRILTEESVAAAASWLSAKWIIYGEFQTQKKGASLVIDFIPSQENMIPFRHSRAGKLNMLQPGFHKAFQQFMRYLSAGYLPPERDKSKDFTALRSLAEALDREYGWSVEAEPGKAQEIVAGLIKTDVQLARFLFSPTLYPALQPAK